MNEEVIAVYKVCIQIIDTVAARGAIQGEELFNVGAVRTQMVNTINDYDKSVAQSKATHEFLVETHPTAEQVLGGVDLSPEVGDLVRSSKRQPRG